MKNPFKREIAANTYEYERVRLLDWLNNAEPEKPEYKEVMNRLNELDRMMNRTTELKKTIIPAFGTGAAVLGIYAVQQFGGVIVPKVMETIAARQERKKEPETD